MHNQSKAAFEGLYRTDTRDYPEEALREALMNALVRRDYSNTTAICSEQRRQSAGNMPGKPAGTIFSRIDRVMTDKIKLLKIQVCSQ